MLQIKLNQKPIALQSTCSLAELVKQHVATTAPFAVAVNKTFVPKQQYTEVTLQQNDEIDIVTAMQGG